MSSQSDRPRRSDQPDPAINYPLDMEVEAKEQGLPLVTVELLDTMLPVHQRVQTILTYQGRLLVQRLIHLLRGEQTEPAPIVLVRDPADTTGRFFRMKHAPAGGVFVLEDGDGLDGDLVHRARRGVVAAGNTKGGPA